MNARLQWGRGAAVRMKFSFSNMTKSALARTVGIAFAPVYTLSSSSWIVDISMQRCDTTGSLAAAETIIWQAKEQNDDAITE